MTADREEFDSGDIDALDDLVRSNGWRILMLSMSMELERRRRDLEAQGRGVEITEFTRGYIAGLRLVADLPIALQRQIQAELKETT